MAIKRESSVGHLDCLTFRGLWRQLGGWWWPQTTVTALGRLSTKWRQWRGSQEYGFFYLTSGSTFAGSCSVDVGLGLGGLPCTWQCSRMFMSYLAAWPCMRSLNEQWANKPEFRRAKNQGLGGQFSHAWWTVAGTWSCKWDCRWCDVGSC